MNRLALKIGDRIVRLLLLMIGVGIMVCIVGVATWAISLVTK